jgi:hypothetical protein
MNLPEWFKECSEAELEAERKRADKDKSRWLSEVAAISRMLRLIEYRQVPVKV